MLNLQIKSTIRCSDREVGVVSHVVINAVSKEISHAVLLSGEKQLLIPIEDLSVSETGDAATLRCASSELSKYPPFRKEEFHELKEVELAGVERRLRIYPGEPLIPVPGLERDITRRKFFTNLINAIGVVLALPLVYPILRYLIHPMYPPYDNTWLKLASVSNLEVDVPQLVRFQKTVTEGFLTREFRKSHWVVKPSPELRELIYDDGPTVYRDEAKKIYWENDPNGEVVVMSGKCTHLGCAFKWKENHRKFGKVFWCPCHLSIFDPAGKVLDGPAPRRLDILPVRTNSGGAVEIIDAEFKAGKNQQIRVV